VYTDECGGFKDLRGANVLIYFPHGFGDWVQLSHVLALLEPSNRYWIAGFGDGNVGVIEGHATVMPAYPGTHGPPDPGDASTLPDLGLHYETLDGSERDLHLTSALHELCERNRIDAVLWCSFPETHGAVPFPYQSKARNVVRWIASEQRAARIDFGLPLTSSLAFAVPRTVRRWVESRLRDRFVPRGRKLCIVVRNGYTSVGKNWGHRFREDLPVAVQREGEECRDFMRLMVRKDPRWMFLVTEERLFEGDDTVRSPDLHCFSYAQAFGTVETPVVPHGLVMKVLANAADLCVGVPSGPYHLCMAKAELPTIGLWIEHLPSWYDEPKPASIHVLSRNTRDAGLHRRPGSFFSRGQLQFRTLALETRVIPGADVVTAAEQLLH
jgi:hypothetical protein